jgi:prevent-host-death family protein
MYITYMSAEMSISEARADLGPVTNRVQYGGETIYLTKHGKRAAAVVSANAAELLEQLEDLFDAEAVAAALAELESGRDTPQHFVRRTRHEAS